MNDNEAPDGAFVVDEQLIEFTGDFLQDKLSLHLVTEQFKEIYGERAIKSVGVELVVDNTPTVKELHATNKEIEKQVFQNINSANPNYEKKYRIPTPMLGDAMLHIIDNGSEVKDSISHISSKYNIPEQQIIDAKNHRLYNQSEVLDYVEDNSTKLDKVDNYNRNTLAKSSTANQMLSETYEVMRIYGEIDSLRKEVSILKARQNITDKKVENIESYLRISCDPKILQAITLKHEGMTHKQISKELGVSSRTIIRWLKSVKDVTMT